MGGARGWGAGWNPATQLPGGRSGSTRCLFPLLGSISQSKPWQSTGRLPCSAPVNPQQWGPSLGKGYPQMGKGPGVSLPRELPYHRLPSQPRHPLESGQKQRREHSGSLAGFRESHRDSFGKLLAAGCYCHPQPASPGSAAAASAGSWQHVPQPPDQHQAHLCIAFCFPDQGHSVQLQYLSKLPKQLGWKLA